MSDQNLEEDIKEYGVEWLIIEQSIKDFTIEKNKDLFIELLQKNSINWGCLLDHAFRQKIVPMLVYKLIETQMFSKCPSYLQAYLRLLLDYNQMKTEIYRKEAQRIVQCFLEENIHYVCTKGIVLESTLYDGKGFRSLSDIDFIVAPKDRNVVIQKLSDLGYDMGVYSWEKRLPIKYTRQQYLKYIVTGNKIPNHFLVLDKSVLPCVYTGFDMSLGWTGFPYEIDVEKALRHVEYFSFPGEAVPICTFDCCYHYMYIILHLIKHAWSTYLQQTENDCNLSQFCDVIWYWRKYRDELLLNFVNIIKENNVLQPVVWVLAHTDRTFKTSIVHDLGLDAEVSEEWLQTTISKTGYRRLLAVSMRRKLFLVNKNDAYIDVKMNNEKNKEGRKL